ncbi:hypothetical protein GCM10023165_20450 [Variovorax defluvii]|uniref:Uncharacterized protein n=1 Tax=Variovorax defluvii TaxID=913761 RepID=A0ABP8HK27_9BURK
METKRPESDGLARRSKGNERTLRKDIHLLGRILGDVIQELEGAATFDLVERIRKMSVAFPEASGPGIRARAD